MDGGWHRAAVDGDRGAEKSGRYKGYLDSFRPTGFLEHFRDPAKTGPWKSGASAPVMSSAELEARERRIVARRATIARHCNIVWRGSPAASADHPYLRRKGISADGLRTDRRGRLRVPMVDFDGHIGSLQTIDGQGRKRFSKGSCVTGLHLLLGSLTPGATLLIAKGYATFRPVVVQYRAAIPKPWYHSLHWLQVSFRIMLGNGTYRA
jgi:phage/plasmid primase-like uncharacterized protein